MFEFIEGGTIIKFQNDWTVSIQSGWGYRSTSTDSMVESVEVGVWHEDSPDVKIHEFASPEEVANIIYKVSKKRKGS